MVKWQDSGGSALENNKEPKLKYEQILWYLDDELIKVPDYY